MKTKYKMDMMIMAIIIATHMVLLAGRSFGSFIASGEGAGFSW